MIECYEQKIWYAYLRFFPLARGETIRMPQDTIRTIKFTVSSKWLNPDCVGIPAGLHRVPQLFLYPKLENAQEVPNNSTQMYSCAHTKINSREPSWMVWKYSSLQAVHIKMFFMQFLWPQVENEQCHCHRYLMLN